MGIVSGSRPQKQVLKLLQLALEAEPGTWSNLVDAFQAETDKSYEKALKEEAPAWWKKWLDDPRAQYDHHAQVVFRIRDQDKRPARHFDVYLESEQADTRARPIQTLFEDSILFSHDLPRLFMLTYGDELGVTQHISRNKTDEQEETEGTEKS